MSDYITMKQLGQLYGFSSHQVGKALKDIGLRTPEGKPTYQAHQGYCEPHFAANGIHYCWAWHATKVGELFELYGIKRKAASTIPCDGSEPANKEKDGGRKIK